MRDCIQYGSACDITDRYCLAVASARGVRYQPARSEAGPKSSRNTSSAAEAQMARYLGTVLLAVVVAVAGCQKPDDSGAAAGWELKPPAADAQPVAASEKMPGIYPAGSRIKDREALGGFGP